MRPTYCIISIKIGAREVIDGVDITITYYGEMKTRHYDSTDGTSHEVCITINLKPWPRGRAGHLRSTPRSEPWRSAISSLHPISPSSPTSSSVEEREEFGAHSTMNGAIKVGAWGGNGGSAFDMGPAHRIISVTIFSGDVVDAVDVTFNYYGKTETRHFGGSGGNPHKIVLEEDESLVGMEGEFASYHGVVVVGKLGFTTNKNAYGPFGNTGGTPFSLPIAAGKISGFFGRDGQFLDAIGVYLEP
ncbi:unnamed protein product [Musa textilis]